MADIIDISKRILKQENGWVEKGLSALASVSEEDARAIIDFFSQYTLKEIRIGLGLDEIDEDIELPIFNAVHKIYEEAAGGCYFCSDEVDPNAEQFGPDSKLCPMCQLKLANFTEALNIPADKVFKGMQRRSVQSVRIKQ